MTERSVLAMDWRSKGLPTGSWPVTRDEIAAMNWQLTREDLTLPVAVLKQTALTHNSDWMRRFIATAGVQIAPHGKTTMSRELFALQMADGAWGMTAATVGHVRIYREFGLDRILLANQLVGRQGIRYIVEELNRDPKFDFYCLIDSFESLALLEAGLVENGLSRPMNILVELGYAGGRAGMRDDEQAIELARKVAASPIFSLRGIEAFEGIVQGSTGDEAKVVSLLDRVQHVGNAVHAEGLFSGKPILSAGGSSFFDLVAAKLGDGDDAASFEVILRSGCYLVHDSHFYQHMIDRLTDRSPLAAGLGEGLRPALELWAYVHSRPEPTRLIVGLGKRDTSDDVAAPNLLGWCRPGSDAVLPLTDHRTVRLDDQHAYLDIPADSPLQPGDMVIFGVSHPCTTFDKWRTMFVIDDALRVVDIVETNF